MEPDEASRAEGFSALRPLRRADRRGFFKIAERAGQQLGSVARQRHAKAKSGIANQ